MPDFRTLGNPNCGHDYSNHLRRFYHSGDDYFTHRSRYYGRFMKHRDEERSPQQQHHIAAKAATTTLVGGFTSRTIQAMKNTFVLTLAMII